MTRHHSGLVGAGQCPGDNIPAGVADLQLHFNNNGDYPDLNPAFGCLESDSDNCKKTRNGDGYWSAIDGRPQILSSYTVTDFVRFKSVYLQLTLDDAYADIAAVDMWFSSSEVRLGGMQYRAVGTCCHRPVLMGRGTAPISTAFLTGSTCTLLSAGLG